MRSTVVGVPLFCRRVPRVIIDFNVLGPHTLNAPNVARMQCGRGGRSPTKKLKKWRIKGEVLFGNLQGKGNYFDYRVVNYRKIYKVVQLFNYKMELQIDEKAVIPQQNLEGKLAWIAKITHVFPCDS